MASPFVFSRKSFAYFADAAKHGTDVDWFPANRARYQDTVEVPMTHLVMALKERLSPGLPGIAFTPRKLSKPTMRAKGEGCPVVRSNSYALFAEPSESMFENNPGIYIDLGHARCVMGCGLHEPSSRQFRELRPRFDSDGETLRAILKKPALRKQWTGLGGKRYTRFPKGCDEGSPGAEFVWFKQFFLGCELSRADVLDPAFVEKTADAFAAAVPFLQWTRQAVGLYKRPKPAEDMW